MDSWMVLKNQLLCERRHAKIFLATDMECPGTVIVKSKEADFAESLKTEEYVYDDLLFDCPNVVTCYGHYTSYEDDIEIYNLVMEYATEGSMESLMKNGKLINNGSGSIDVVDQIRVYSKMILKGLDHIHESGYVHCNLDPTNILTFMPDVDEADMEARYCYTLKIADFKLSKRVGESVVNYGSKRTYWSQFRGNPRYMSPESVLYEEHEPPMDIWAFGCLVAEMSSAVMTGGLPVREHRKLAARRVLLGVAPEIPKNMCFWGVDFLYRCFARRPECRWTAKKLLKHPFITGGVCGRFGYTMPMDYSCDNVVLKAEEEDEEADNWALACFADFDADFDYDDAGTDYDSLDEEDTDEDDVNDDHYDGESEGDDDGASTGSSCYI